MSKRKDDLIFRWPETGKLHIRFDGNESATLRFKPSRQAIIKLLQQGSTPGTKDGSNTNTHPPNKKGT